MMPEISLNILDVAQNSVKAKASLIEISVFINQSSDTLTVIIKDNGTGMTKDQLEKVEDPFYTTRTTRKVGLGIPFFKLAAECTGGHFTLNSVYGKGTEATAIFCLSHIDRMPLGDMTSTIHTLITMNPQIDFVYTYRLNEKFFALDTKEFRSILGDVPLNNPEVSAYIKEYLEENKNEVGFID